MTRIWLPLFGMFAASLANPTPPSPRHSDWQAQGQINSSDFTVEHRDGNVVAGTEFVHYEYRVSTELVPKDDTRVKLTFKHDNHCNGGKHKDHASCDLSCDTQDKTTKKGTLKGETEDLTSEMRAMEQESAKMAASLGMPGGPDNWSSETSGFISQTKADCKAQTENIEDKPHNKPCTLLTRKYGLKKTELRVKGEFWKVGFYRSKGVNTPINDMVASHEHTVVNLWYPQKDPLSEVPVVTCKCKEVPKDTPCIAEPPPEGGSAVGPVDGPAFDGCQFYDYSGTPCEPYPGQVIIECKGGSLTDCEVDITNRCGTDMECVIEQGCTFVPDDGGTQTMCSTRSARAKCQSGKTTRLFVSLKPAPVFEATPIAVKLACTQIAKHEPNSRTKFKIVAPGDPVLVSILAQPTPNFMATANLQGRVWIYEDQSSIEEINKRMAPGLTEGMYVNALHDVAMGGVNLADPKYRKCVQPSLLTGSTANEDATRWFVQFLADTDPKALSKAVDAVASGLQAKAENLDFRHAGYVASALSDCGQRELALRLMEKGMPDSGKSEFLNEGGLSALHAAIMFGDDALATRAIGVARMYATPETKKMLDGCGAWAKTEALRGLAAAAAKEMS